MARPKGGSAKHDKDTEKVLPTSIENKEDESLSDKEGIRDAINEMLQANMKNLPKWLEEIGQNDPMKALNMFQAFAEYVLPKQQRTDNKESKDNAVTVVFDVASNHVAKQYTPPSDSAPKKKFELNDLIK